MMLCFKSLLWGILVVFLASCNSRNDEITHATSFPFDNVIRVSTENRAFTRGGYETGNLTEFRLFILHPTSTHYTYENVPMRKVNNEFRSYNKEDDSPFTMFWQNSSVNVDVIAMTKAMEPLGESLNVSVEANQTEKKAIEESDFLYYQKIGFNPDLDLIDTKIPLKFTHMCAKLRLTLNLVGISSSPTNPVADIQIKGIKLKKDFNPMTGEWNENFASADSSIIPFTVSYSPDKFVAVYDCILIPQKKNSNSLIIDFAVAGKNYNYTIPEEIVFESNTMYQLSINVED